MVLKKNTSIRLELTGGDKKEDLVTRRGCIASRLHSGSKVREGRGKSRTVTREFRIRPSQNRPGRCSDGTIPTTIQPIYVPIFFFSAR